MEEISRSGKQVKVHSPEKDTEYTLEADLLHPLIKGGDSKRYQLTRTNRLILFPYGSEQGSLVKLIPESIFKTRYPLTWNYLSENKRYLEGREKGKMKGSGWYGYVYPKALDVMSLPKIFTPDLASQSSFSLDESGELFFTGGVAGGYGLLPKPEYSRKYLLGLLNSKLLEWFIHQTATQMRGGWYSYESRFIRSMPIRTLDPSIPAEREAHDRMAHLVDQILEAKKQLPTARTEREKNFYQTNFHRANNNNDPR